MDDIVRQALAKWPNVPHCYGWLALDARGHWRMRDERAQALRLPGERISNPALIGFIERNYLHDELGRWYFQNGPQRVYVHLEATPFIARSDPVQGFILHTGAALDHVDAAWLTDEGQLILTQRDIAAMLDDRDIAQCLSQLHWASSAAPVTDDELLAWLAAPATTGELRLHHREKAIPVTPIRRDALAATFGFVAEPHAE